MSLSCNIKRLRLQKNLTQEQLAAALGVSAQAISKWETSETYPDGTLLVPLAKELDVSLDELFDNDNVSMADISRRIIQLLYDTDEKERFAVVRDIGWQIERGLFGCLAPINREYDPNEFKEQQNHSYILDNYGFTLISNGSEPFFSVFPEPENGFGDFLKEQDHLQAIFAALSRPDTMKALAHIFRKADGYVFESAVLATDCGIDDEKTKDVMDDLLLLAMVYKQTLTINGTPRTLYRARPNHRVLALLLIAKEICYQGGYSLQSHSRNTPFIK